MAGRVESMIHNSIVSLINRDPDLAHATIAEDAVVNRGELETDRLCMVILARRQPMGPDLRFITFALKMVTDLERIGDLAVNICERAIDLCTLPALPRPWADIERMAEIARIMVGSAIDAFVKEDGEAARAVIERDDEVDDLYAQIFQDILALMKERPDMLRPCIHVQSVAKWIERMADHATNLAEQVIFMIDGMDVRHEGKLGIELPAEDSE